MTNQELQTLKNTILNLLTDKNVGNIDLESDAERFGAMMALNYAFNKVMDLFNNYETESYSITCPNCDGENVGGNGNNTNVCFDCELEWHDTLII